MTTTTAHCQICLKCICAVEENTESTARVLLVVKLIVEENHGNQASLSIAQTQFLMQNVLSKYVNRFGSEL